MSRLERMEAAEERLAQHTSNINKRERAILDRIDRIGKMASPQEYRRPGAAVPKSKQPHEKPIAIQNIPERIMGRNDIVSVEFLETGLLAKRSVCRLSSGAGTGFHIGLGLIMTAAHSLPTKAEASEILAEFDVEEHKIGDATPVISYILDPSSFWFRDPDFDFAICAATALDPDAPALDRFGWQVLSSLDEDISAGVPVSIIHHPDGGDKSLTVHNSHFVDSANGEREDRYCWYSGDTRGGSSGAPIFDPNWALLAIHQSSVPLRDTEGALLNHNAERLLRNGQAIFKLKDVRDISEVGVFANEGTRASRIAAHLAEKVLDDPTHDAKREALLKLWSRAGARYAARRAAMAKIRIG